MPTEDEILLRAKARVGTTINARWLVDRVVGVGGMAVVYAATHCRNNKRAALKLLHPELSLDPGIRARFLREGYAANTVDHPGVVRIDDDGVTEDGATFIVMELLDGESLDAWQAREGGRLSTTSVLSIADQLLDVLASSHAKGIIHRDLKPENIFVQKSGALKVLDFGIARVREAGAGSLATRAGALIGTPSYMAPEQARGLTDEVDARTDLWSVGATMFKLLSGRLVHEAATVNEILARSILQHAPPISSVVPDLDPRVAAIVDRALAFDKHSRYPDARAMQAAVREASAALTAVDAAPKAASFPSAASAATPLLSAAPPPVLTTSRPVVAGSTVTHDARRTLAVVAAACLAAGILIAVALRLATSSSSGPVAPPVAEPPASLSSIETAGGAPAASADGLLPVARDDSGVAPVPVSELPTPRNDANTPPISAKSASPATSGPAMTASIPAKSPPGARTAPPTTTTAAPPAGQDPFSRRR